MKGSSQDIQNIGSLIIMHTHHVADFKIHHITNLVFCQTNRVSSEVQLPEGQPSPRL